VRAGLERHLHQLERHLRRTRRYLGESDDRHSVETRETAGVS
jgi:hypothetical protein